MIEENKYIYIESLDGKKRFRVDFNDLNKTFSRDFKVNTTYEVSFTLTYTEQYKDVFNVAKPKAIVWYNGETYAIQEAEPGIDEKGLTTKTLTCSHTIIDKMKNIRQDKQEPTEDNPEITNTSTTGGSNDDNSTPKDGTTVKKTAEKETYSLESCLHKFIDGNDQGVSFDIKGNFPQMSIDVTGSLYEWMNNNLKSFGAYWVPQGNVIHVYDLDNLKHPTGKVFRYMNNMTNADVQYNVRDIVNDCWVYGGKMEKDITVAGGSGNGISEPQNGDWTPVIQNAASLVGEHLSQADINLILAQINLESGGREGVPGGDDGLPDGIAKGLLQFKQGTFDYYCRPPYTNIWHGLDQIIALFNVPNWRNQITGHSGWSPHGAPVSKDTIQVSTGGGWGWPFPSTGEGHFDIGQTFGTHPQDGVGRENGFHDGLDFGSIDHPGSEVHAVHGGTCTISRAWGSGGINWYCVITDSTGLNVEYQEAFGSASNITVNVGQKVNTGDVIGYRTTDHLHLGITRSPIPAAFSHAFNNDGTWLDPLATIKNGGAGSGGSDGGTTSSTTTEVYYALHFHYEDQDSINKYGRHRGKPIVEDSIYDMDILKQYVENTVQHEPLTTLTIKGITDSGNDGDVWHLIAPELGIDTDVTLMGIKGNDDAFLPKAEQDLSFNNLGVAMQDVNAAIWNDINEVNTNINPLNIYGGSGQSQENHFSNQSNKKDTSQTVPSYSKNDMSKFTDFMNGKDVSLNAS